MASAPFSTAARAHSQSPAGARSSGAGRGGRGAKAGLSCSTAIWGTFFIRFVAVDNATTGFGRVPKRFGNFMAPARASSYSSAMRVLIVGCGYVGLPLGVELARQGHEVFGVRRTKVGEAELTAAGVKLLAADITRPGELVKLPAPFDWVVNTVSSTKGGVEEYQQVYLDRTRHLLEWLAP